MRNSEIVGLIIFQNWVSYLFGMFYEKNTLDSINLFLFIIFNFGFSCYLGSKINNKEF